jgi:hypothetical protein
MCASINLLLVRLNGFDQPTPCFEKDRAISQRNRRAKIVKNIYKWCARTDYSARDAPHPSGVALRAINLAEAGQVVEPAFCLSAVRIIANQYSDTTIVLRYTKILVRPDGLFGAGRASPLRGRPAGDQLGRSRPSCRTGFLSVGGSNYRQPIFRHNDRFAVYQNFGAPGRIRTADHCVRSAVLYPAELRAPARSLALMEPIGNLAPAFRRGIRLLTVLLAQSAAGKNDFSGHPGGVVRGEKYRH